MAGQNYKDLIAWQRAMDLVEMVYKLTKLFPKEELYGLTSQIRRAAVSIPSNIAEGQGRKSKGEFAHFLAIAYGSLREVETQTLISERLLYLQRQEVDRLMDLTAEIGRLINGLANSLSSR